MTEQVARETNDYSERFESMKAEQEAWREKSERQRLENLWWAAVIIWAGIVFLADYLAILPQVREEGPWSWIFLGAGVLGLAGALIRASSANLPEPTGWDYFWSAVFVVIGGTGFFGGGITFPIFLVVIGLAILFNGLFRRA